MLMTATPLVLLLGLVGAGCSADAKANAASTRDRGEQIVEAREKPETQRKVVIPVEGMACESCAARLQARLASIDGVSKASVDFARKEARVTFDPKKISLKALVEEIDKTFKAGTPRAEDRT